MEYAGGGGRSRTTGGGPDAKKKHAVNPRQTPLNDTIRSQSQFHMRTVAELSSTAAPWPGPMATVM